MEFRNYKDTKSERGIQIIIRDWLCFRVLKKNRNRLHQQRAALMNGNTRSIQRMITRKCPKLLYKMEFVTYWFKHKRRSDFSARLLSFLTFFQHSSQVLFECCSSTFSGLPDPSYAFLMESAKLRLPPKRLLQKSPIVSESQMRSRQSEFFSCKDKTAVLQPNSAYPVSNGINTQQKKQRRLFQDTTEWFVVKS